MEFHVTGKPLHAKVLNKAHIHSAKSVSSGLAKYLSSSVDNNDGIAALWFFNVDIAVKISAGSKIHSDASESYIHSCLILIPLSCNRAL